MAKKVKNDVEEIEATIPHYHAVISKITELKTKVFEMGKEAHSAKEELKLLITHG